ncbi:MAG: hypothetical protein AAFR17_02115 [Pseudomonadota bacterium]
MSSKTMRTGTRALAISVSALALSTSLAAAQTATEAAVADLMSSGKYLSGDKHNHTTCTDGSTSIQALVNESIVTYELDWFAQTGHGGEGVRDCRFTDPEYDGANTGEGDFWENTVGLDAIKGDEETTGGFGAGAFFEDGNGREMWRWQMLTEYSYPLLRGMARTAEAPVWLGIESVVPGHEHVSMAIIDQQMRSTGNAYSTGQFEYLFDRSDDDTSGGEENDFENPANNGEPKNFDTAGFDGHARSVRSVEWLRENFPFDSYYVPAHVERQGGFDFDGTRGFNVEHFRDYHTAGLFNSSRGSQSVAMGAEMIAGHQAPNGGRGTYEADRPSAGFGTYGGAGAYSAAEVTVPGKDFDGNDITNATLNEIRAELNALFEDQFTEPSGSDAYDQLDACSDCADPAPEGIGTVTQERLVLGRPGIATMWDALLGEGRRFWNFGSSDWHNRGQFGPFEPQTTLDFFPGEYQKIWVRVPNGENVGFNRGSATRITSAMRRGDHFSVMGDLIDEFYFVICQGDKCATMGQQLNANPNGEDLEWRIVLKDPEGVNNSPYTFDNPSLLQLDISTPMNEPVLSHIDVISGEFSERIDPEDPEYTTNVANPTTAIFASVDNLAGEFDVDGEFLVASGTIEASSLEADTYFRVRGTNMPKGTPNETDADGNPLLDDFALLIPCTAEGDADLDQTAEVASNAGSSFNVRNQVLGQFDPSACPAHLPVDSDGVKRLDADVEAWADLWFYAQPIFVNIPDSFR